MKPEHRAAFLAAGIPPAFLEGSLTALGVTGQPLVTYVKSVSFLSDLAEGKGVWLEGDDALAEEACYHLMKSAMVRSINCFVGTPLAILDILNSGDELDADDENSPSARLWRAESLYVPCFNDPFYATNPLAPSDRHNLEDFLLSRMRNNVAINVHYQDGPAWWSPRLMRWLQNKSERIVL